jgi:hypothetical protein
VNPIGTIPSIAFSLIDFYADIDTYKNSRKQRPPVKYLILCNQSASIIAELRTKADSGQVIVLGKDRDYSIKNCKALHWYKQEMEVMGQYKISKPLFCMINNGKIEKLVERFDTCIQNLKDFEEPIELPVYPYYLRLILNAMNNSEWDKLESRLNQNKDLERNDGEYTLEEIGEDNPKKVLQELIAYLREYNPKRRVLLNNYINYQKPVYGILKRDINEDDALNDGFMQKVSIRELRKMEKEQTYAFKALVFCSYNSRKDFELLRNLSCPTIGILFSVEKQLYNYHEKWLENTLDVELQSIDREALLETKYTPVSFEEITPSPTLKEVSDELKECDDDNYDELNEFVKEVYFDNKEKNVKYEIHWDNNRIDEFKAEETVLHQGKWCKIYGLNVGDKVQVYPRETFAERLLEVALQKNEDKVQKINQHAKYWQNRLNILYQVYQRNPSTLHKALQEKGLRVQQNTVESYLNGKRMFPMYYKDLKAIIDLANDKLANKDNAYPEIRASKKWYSSTLISLGRELKKEIECFVSEDKIGRILASLDFDEEGLERLLNEQMPVLTILKLIPKTHEPF